MTISWNQVTHITKIDPAEELPSDLAILTNTDMVIIGGSDGVTETNAFQAIRAIRAENLDLPLVQEPSDPAQISLKTIQAVDQLLIPAVFNGDRDSFVTKHVEFLTEVIEDPGELLGIGSLPWGDDIVSERENAISTTSDKIVGEGYVIQNPDSKAGAESGVKTPYSPAEISGAAAAAESLYGFPVLYVEYSGEYGGPEDVRAAARCLDDTQLVYGGGITSQEQSEEILSAGADSIVVGDCFHDDPEQFLDTIPASSPTC